MKHTNVVIFIIAELDEVVLVLDELILIVDECQHFALDRLFKCAALAPDLLVEIVDAFAFLCLLTATGHQQQVNGARVIIQLDELSLERQMEFLHSRAHHLLQLLLQLNRVVEFVCLLESTNTKIIITSNATTPLNIWGYVPADDAALTRCITQTIGPIVLLECDSIEDVIDEVNGHQITAHFLLSPIIIVKYTLVRPNLHLP